jgi:osmotically-inducible protein OsmY
MSATALLLRIALIGLLIGGTGGGAAAQRARTSDSEIERLVTDRLQDEDIGGVDVTAASGIVTLRGTVPTLWLKKRAIEEATRVDDVISVVSELTVPRGESDAVIAEQVARRLRRYVFFTIFDDADIEVDNGLVTLTGRVTMPYKTDAFVDLAGQVAGVQEVRSEIRTLPVSRFDDQLRYAIARRIYGDLLFWSYAIQVNPPVHIIVEHGAVTLTGVVNSEVERRKAESIARSTFGVMSVTNTLRVERND